MPDPEIKKHVCRFLRSVSHTIGANLIFYSMKNASLTKVLRDVLSNLGFGSPLNPVRSHKIDYNEPLIISSASDSWEQIGVLPSNSERVGISYSAQVPQQSASNEELPDPGTDTNFREAIVDELRALKDDELLLLIKNTEMKIKYDSFNLSSSPFNFSM